MTYTDFGNSRKPAEEISTCVDLVNALEGAVIYNGALIFPGEEEPKGMEVGVNASKFKDIFSIVPMKEIDGFQTLKVSLKGGRLGALTKAGLLHDVLSVALTLRGCFIQEGIGVDMAVSTRSNGDNLPGVYLYILPKGMLYTNYIEWLAQQKKEEAPETETSQSSPPWTSRKRQNRWGNQ